MENVLIAGGGVLGSQIAFQSAFKGKNVVILEIDEEGLEKAKGRIEKLKATYLEEIDKIEEHLDDDGAAFPGGIVRKSETLTEKDLDALRDDVQAAYESLRFETDKAKAVEDVDFVVEAIVEDEQIKKDFHKELASHLPEKTIISSNSSTMVPSKFADSTGRPEKYLHFHFANSIWRQNIAEIMGHPGTDQETIDKVEEYANEISMVPVIIEKENPGYLLNALLIPLLNASQALYIDGFASVEDIDKTWKISTGAPHGPFEIQDIIGTETLYQVSKNKPNSDEPGTIEYKTTQLFKDMLDQGKLGVQSGSGFYEYED